MPKSWNAEGRSSEDLLQDLNQLKSNDIDWKNGKSFCLSYYGGDDVYPLLEKANAMFMSENALNPTAFKSLRKMENDVVSMVRDLLGSGPENRGAMTTGGTESILLVVKAAREWAKKVLPKDAVPKMILPTTAHPAFDKAAHYFGVDICKVEVCPKSFKPKAEDYEKNFCSRTVLLVASAPSYPHGVIDPVEGVAAIAAKKKILCHVDACIGGMVLGFWRESGLKVPSFDLKTHGVTSISVDLHKYGFCPKGASVVLYKDAKLRRKQFFCCTGWEGGVYISSTILGSKSGGPIAAAWACLQYFGKDGYLQKFNLVHELSCRFLERIEATEGVHSITKEVESSILAIASDDVDIFRVADRLQDKGWTFDRNTTPPSIHLSIMPVHSISIDQFFTDLKDSIELAQKEDSSGKKILGAITNAAIKLTPKSLIQKVARSQTKSLGDASERTDTASIYGMMGSLEKKGALGEVALDILDGLYDQ